MMVSHGVVISTEWTIHVDVSSAQEEMLSVPIMVARLMVLHGESWDTRGFSGFLRLEDVHAHSECHTISWCPICPLCPHYSTAVKGSSLLGTASQDASVSMTVSSLTLSLSLCIQECTHFCPALWSLWKRRITSTSSWIRSQTLWSTWWPKLAWLCSSSIVVWPSSSSFFPTSDTWGEGPTEGTEDAARECVTADTVQAADRVGKIL